MKPLGGELLEASSGSFVADEIIREFIWLATGRVIPAHQTIQLSDFSIPITETLINRLAVLGLATLAYKTRRGSEKSAAYLVDRCLGTPQKPFKEAVNEMSLEQATELLKAEFKGSLAINDTLAEDIVKKLVALDVKENG